MSSLFYIYPSCGRALVIPIITRDTNIVNNTVFEPVLRKDTIFGLTFATRNRKALVPTNMNWGQLQVYHLCPISPLHTEDMWRTQSSPETPILSRILSLNQFYVKIPFLGLLFSIWSQQIVAKNELHTEDNNRSVILNIYPPFIRNSCGGLNHLKRHQYFQKYCLWTSFA